MSSFAFLSWYAGVHGGQEGPGGKHCSKERATIAGYIAEPQCSRHRQVCLGLFTGTSSGRPRFLPNTVPTYPNMVQGSLPTCLLYRAADDPVEQQQQQQQSEGEEEGLGRASFLPPRGYVYHFAYGANTSPQARHTSTDTPPNMEPIGTTNTPTPPHR